ncbi:hypothetical protein [Mycetocola saprophilus]|uniref:hypothetical protein n=1 Tax=Mycetocola saprophilus TaxID=76636 RepID=UPI003BF25428
MAAKYSLQPNEVVFLKDESVMHGGFWSAYTDELMLTNLNLVLIKKGLFGNSKGITTFPVNQIKVYNQQAQAVIGKAMNGSDLLEVYFLNGRKNSLSNRVARRSSTSGLPRSTRQSQARKRLHRKTRVGLYPVQRWLLVFSRTLWTYLSPSSLPSPRRR